MLLKGKFIGKIKVRSCVYYCPQREYISKDKSSLPTVLIYALMASCLVDVIEKKIVYTADIPRAFLQSDWLAERPQYLPCTGMVVGMILEIDPSYTEYVRILVGKQVYYLLNSTNHYMVCCWEI